MGVWFGLGFFCLAWFFFSFGGRGHCLVALLMFFPPVLVKFLALNLQDMLFLKILTWLLYCKRWQEDTKGTETNHKTKTTTMFHKLSIGQSSQTHSSEHTLHFNHDLQYRA